MVWYYKSDGRELGPVNDSELQELLGAGKITRDTPVRQEKFHGTASLVLERMSGAMSVFGNMVLLVRGIIWGAWKGRVIAATKIDKERVWVSGVGKEFLKELPEYPG